MSWIWNVMLSVSSEECYLNETDEEPLKTPPPIEKLNEWLEADEVRNYGPLTDLTAGTDMSAYVFGGGFKHFDIEEFINVVSNQEWKNKDKVQLFVQYEEIAKWTILDFSEDTESEE